MSPTTTQQKIQRLQALIDHKRTGEAERDTARRMLARVIENARKNDVVIANTGWVDRRAYGAKYDSVRTLPLKEITKLMRADVKLARKLGAEGAEPGAVALMDALGTMPAAVKVSITGEYYSGGRSIDVRIKNIPTAWGFVWGVDRYGHLRWLPSPALTAVVAELTAVHWAYNYDGSDIQSDYWDRNYMGSVTYDRPERPIG